MLFPSLAAPSRPSMPLLLLRRWRRLAFLVLTLFLLYHLNARKHPFIPHAHTTQHQALLPSSLPASALCARHNLPAYPRPPRKIYDLLMLSTELDMLAIRLATMAPHVTYFILLESPHTFTGRPKPLLYTPDLFPAYAHQIIHVVLEGMPLNAPRTWDLEDYQRNALLLQGVLGKQMVGERAVAEGDVLIVADIDEIVRPEALRVLRECDVPARVTLRSQFYYYGFQWRHRGQQWAHPQATIYRGKNTILPADLRNGEGGNRVVGWWEKIDLWDAGWHCSSCFKTVEEVLNKMQSFSHTSLNAEQFRDPKRIADRVRKGLDLWDREGEFYDRVEDNQDVPKILKDVKEKDKFGYLLDRDGPNAGFTDYKQGP